MPQISLRQFRERIASNSMDEPVEVSRRDQHGNIEVLGFWTPYLRVAPGETTDHAPQVHLDLVDAPKIIKTTDDARAVVAAVRPVRPVPKPSQRRAR